MKGARAVCVMGGLAVVAACSGEAAPRARPSAVPSTERAVPAQSTLRGPDPCTLVGDELRQEVLGPNEKARSEHSYGCVWRSKSYRPEQRGPKALSLHISVFPGPDGSTWYEKLPEATGEAYFREKSVAYGNCRTISVPGGQACWVYPRGLKANGSWSWSPDFLTIPLRRGGLGGQINVFGGNLRSMPSGKRGEIATRLANEGSANLK
nr:hypothetical protein GCM10010200_030380 [Actinomadura rugatobispora]